LNSANFWYLAPNQTRSRRNGWTAALFKPTKRPRRISMVAYLNELVALRGVVQVRLRPALVNFPPALAWSGRPHRPISLLRSQRDMYASYRDPTRINMCRAPPKTMAVSTRGTLPNAEVSFLHPTRHFVLRNTQEELGPACSTQHAEHSMSLRCGAQQACQS
jgi:hypothetical protein